MTEGGEGAAFLVEQEWHWFCFPSQNPHVPEDAGRTPAASRKTGRLTAHVMLVTMATASNAQVCGQQSCSYVEWGWGDVVEEGSSVTSGLDKHRNLPRWATCTSVLLAWSYFEQVQSSVNGETSRNVSTMLAHRASDRWNQLARQENLLAPVYWTRCFSSPAHSDVFDCVIFRCLSTVPELRQDNFWLILEFSSKNC